MEYFKIVIEGIFRFMCEITIPVFGYSVSLWSIFLFGALGFLGVWFLRKFF